MTALHKSPLGWRYWFCGTIAFRQWEMISLFLVKAGECISFWCYEALKYIFTNQSPFSSIWISSRCAQYRHYQSRRTSSCQDLLAQFGRWDHGFVIEHAYVLGRKHNLHNLFYTTLPSQELRYTSSLAKKIKMGSPNRIIIDTDPVGHSSISNYPSFQSNTIQRLIFRPGCWRRACYASCLFCKTWRTRSFARLYHSWKCGRSKVSLRLLFFFTHWTRLRIVFPVTVVWEILSRCSILLRKSRNGGGRMGNLRGLKRWWRVSRLVRWSPALKTR
jgi:hypothetical protein